ncbi:MAG TPA: hypothetical protein VF070_20590 [Streptosporangiaceae bacterium]
MKAVAEPAGLVELRERRAFECRLTPDRALGSLDEAEGFLRDRGLLTRTTDSALPSLYEACHEDPYRSGAPGFGTWPVTKWPWFGQLAGRGYLVTAVHRGKNMIVSGELTRLLDPICRAEIARLRAHDADWRRLLDHLARSGPTSVEDLPAALGLKRQEVKALRYPLERCGAIVSRSLQMTGGADEPHASELARWDQVYPDGAAAGGPGRSSADGDPVAALKDLVAAGVRAAVVAPERELRRWFSWQWYWHDSLVDDLVREGRVRRLGDYVTAVG